MRGRVVALASLLLACGPSGGAGTGGTVAPGEASRGHSTLVGRVGEVLELTLPLLGGGSLELSELRGHPVLLSLDDKGSPDRDRDQDRYRALVEADEDIMVVSVGLDSVVEDLPAGWQDAPPFVLGWDPQGAVAARLGLVALPTVVLLDPQGRIVSVHEGAPPDDASLSTWLGPGNGT
ncbi:MAG: TlpA family protein disulfide reductase [Myxococcales bacterium]|nr:TlpA family protein disulfide reductase [Myxococcales bacterium]